MALHLTPILWFTLHFLYSKGFCDKQRVAARSGPNFWIGFVFLKNANSRHSVIQQGPIHFLIPFKQSSQKHLPFWDKCVLPVLTGTLYIYSHSFVIYSKIDRKSVV